MEKIWVEEMVWWYVSRRHLDTEKVDRRYWPADSKIAAEKAVKRWNERDAGTYAYSYWCKKDKAHWAYGMRITL